MNSIEECIYPDCPAVTRTVEIGGHTKQELLQKLHQYAISVNEMGDRLLKDERFAVSGTAYSVTTVELKVRHLGFPEGATIPAVYQKAEQLGLGVCPLELGPYLRLSYPDQPEGAAGKPVRQHRSPYGAITVATAKLSEDINFPRGFYLRKIDGVLWLRGYIADDLHVLDPDDCLVFCRT